MQNAYTKRFLGIIIVLVNRFSNFLWHFLRLMTCKKMAWSYFSCGVSEKVRFRKMQFLKDGVQTVVTVLHVHF